MIRGFLLMLVGMCWLTAEFPSLRAAENHDPRLAKLLDNIDASEKLFRNCEAKWRWKYRLHVNDLPLDPAQLHTERRHSIVQGKYYWSHYSSEGKTQSGREYRSGGTLSYDGITSRYYSEEDRSCYVRPGFLKDGRFQVFHPLALICGPVRNYSQWLRGAPEEIPVDPADGLPAYIIELSYQGEEKILEGLTCIKVSRTTRSRAEPNRIIRVKHIWFCPERNYLVAKFQNFEYRFFKDKPMTEGYVKEWQRYAEGIWIPRVAIVTGYSDYHLVAEGRYVPSVTDEFQIDFFALDPSYEREFFTNPPFPEAFIVYEMDESGKIIKAHKPGTYVARTSVIDLLRAGEYNGLLYSMIVVVLAIAAVLVVVWWRRRLTPRQG
jgi:hypothetical protein